MKQYQTREEIPVKYTWDLTGIFADEEKFLSALETAKGYPAQLSAFQGRISQSAEELLAFLRLEDDIDVAMGKLYTYAQRKSDEDTRVSRYQSLSSQVATLGVSLNGACAWFVPELMGIEPERLEGFYQDAPGLEQYRRSLDSVLRRRAHVLSPAEEELLAGAGELAIQPDNIYSLFADADLTFPDAEDSQGQSHPVTHGTFVPLLESQDRALRRSAFRSLYGVYGQYRNTCAAILSAQTVQLKFFAGARKYPSTLDAALDGTEVPVEVYTNLIDAVHRNLPAMHKYTRLRKKLLGVDELHFYDLYVPMTGEVEMTFTYEEACELILNALAPLGEDYCAAVRQGLEQRWVDVYESPGKRSGAYSAGGYEMHPYILMNFQGRLNDVFTLIHEMGHSMHTYLTCRNQPATYSNYVIFVAEVASTCNEALLMQYLLQHTEDKGERAYLINYFLEQFRTTLYRQTMFAEFELEINRIAQGGEGLTADALCELYGRLNREYFGPDIVMDEEISLEWARIPHFYYDYYVYQYATGYAAAIALSEKILSEGPEAAENYLGFLKGGCSKPPIELLRGAGVDMATPEPIDRALARFDALIDEMEELAEA
ncbi:MAG: oligoendopeptidase F [Oscillospiraceae bacterium]|nr:oligoendopeptidase F [Oscillospiraceae bacterium]